MFLAANLPGYWKLLKAVFRGTRWSPTVAEEEAPLRSELFSADQMDLHGKALALSHTLSPEHAPDQLLARLAENEVVLVKVCALLTTAVSTKRPITSAGEWLLDNFYLIGEQIRTARRHLPKGYSRELPRLASLPLGSSESSGSSVGCPRVYDIALEIISHADGRVDVEVLSRFLASYQSTTPLNLGELWAMPIMLRLAVIENLRRVAVRIAADRNDHSLAESWADQMAEIAEKDPKSLILVVADMARSNPPMVSAFVAEFVRRLQGRGPALALPLTWVEQHLSETGQTIEQLVQLEIQQQAADQVSISNSIASLRVLGAVDWREFVESMSVVEQILLEDPEGVYGRMDFGTRDRYRHAVERMAKTSRLEEIDVARKAVDLARQGCSADACGEDGQRAGHVGFYLVDKGVPILERLAGVRLSGLQSLQRTAARFSLILYLCSIALFTTMGAGWFLTQVRTGPVSPEVFYAVLSALGVLLLLAVSQLGVALVNWVATLLVTPDALPRMDFSEGIPPQSRTLVVIPTMLSSIQGVENLAEALEVRFLANRDERLHFALLTDFPDAHEESLPADDPLVQLARKRIDELNAKYRLGEDQSWDDIFFLLHRPRRWNPQEKIWMGYERKRGKLADLNALLRGGAGEAFALVVGDAAVLTSVKYVITLDTDTQLPRDAARQFVGAMAHPLNRPVYDEAKGRIVAGYGILQPRVAISLPGTNRSHFARLYGGDSGIDPYTRVVSDVYQDAFGEGSFIGKGIYDVDAFEQAVGARFPENLILSHDLLEGCYARAGLLSDVDLYEDYPARYAADVARRYRWIRGDWQLAGWLLRRVPGRSEWEQGDADNGRPGTRQKNPLSALSQWKLLDNLRRSLVPAALTLLLLLGWTLLSSAWLWTLVVLGILLIPFLFALIIELIRKPDEVLVRQHLTAVAQTASRRFMQALFELACLPYEAFFSLDAIVRTTGRMLFTHQRLLEWNPSSEADLEIRRKTAGRGNGPAHELAASFGLMWVAPVVSCAAAIHFSYWQPAVLGVAAPMLFLWLASPEISH